MLLNVVAVNYKGLQSRTLVQSGQQCTGDVKDAKVGLSGAVQHLSIALIPHVIHSHSCGIRARWGVNQTRGLTNNLM